MKKILVKNAKIKINEFRGKSIFGSYITSGTSVEIYNILKLIEKLIETEMLVGLSELYIKKEILLIKYKYYNPDSFNLYYKENIPECILEEAKQEFNLVKEELNKLNKQIEILETTTYIEI